MVSELRKLEDALGPLGGPKIFKSITFSIESLKEFGIRRPGPEIALNAIVPPGSQKVSKSITFWIET